MEQYLYALLAILFGALTWFVKAKMADYDTKLTKNADDISVITVSAAAVAQQLRDHTELDDDRFGRIELLLKEGRDDIKEILRNVKR